MTDYIRRLVSGNKARFKDAELKLELDLAYVTDQVVIMGYPASGIEGLYRNRREDAIRFLETRHGKNYWVFNFCPIKENSYDKSVFGGRVSRYPFPDHHAPPLAILPLAAREIRAWLSGSPDRVAVLHCKAGKGRSGTMACAYLVSMDETPMAPQLKRSLSAKDWAKRRIHGAMKALPEEDTEQHEVAQPGTSLTNPMSPTLAKASLDETRTSFAAETGTRPLESFDDPTQHRSLSPPLSPISSSAPWSPTSNPEKSFTDALKGVLDLHTARRMKAPSEVDRDGEKERKVKQGVSIPSQRRFLYYWALLLAHDAPKHLWPVDPPLPIPLDSKATVHPPFRQQKVDSPPKVRLTTIRLKMKETHGVKLGIVKAANKIITKTNMSKGHSVAGGEKESGREEKEKRKSTTMGSSQIWASLARYDDELVSTLERWEVFTRHTSGDLGKRRKGSEHYINPEGNGHEESLSDIFHGDRWDRTKMVRSFARLGVKGPQGIKAESTTPPDPGLKKEKEDKVNVYTLVPLSDRRWEGLKEEIHQSSGGDVEEMGREKTPSETGSIDVNLDAAEEEKEKRSSLAVSKGIVLDAGREVRVKLYMGQVFMGWIWFVPTFHMPQPPPSSSTPPTSTTGGALPISPAPSTVTSPTSATLRLTREEIDFPLGLGSGIVDVEIDLEWVTPPVTPQQDQEQDPASAQVTERIPPLPKPSQESEEMAGQGGLGAAARVVLGAAEGDSGTLRQAVRARQGVED